MESEDFRMVGDVVPNRYKPLLKSWIQHDNLTGVHRKYCQHDITLIFEKHPFPRCLARYPTNHRKVHHNITRVRCVDHITVESTYLDKGYSPTLASERTTYGARYRV